MDEAYIEKRRWVESIFLPANLIPDSEAMYESPCGRYRLTTNRYKNGPMKGAYSRGIVTRSSDGTQLADVKLNYIKFWHSFASHPNGNDYLLCSEDYQGYSVYNLTKGTNFVHFPAAGHDGFGFCWSSADASPDGLMLAVVGCYWAAPYEVVFYDFRTPDELPLAELARIGNLDKAIGWQDNNAFVLTRDVHYRVSDGKPYEDLSEAEQDAIDNDDTPGAYRCDTVRFPRPSVINA